MNAKTTKFLAVLAVLAFAFAAFAIAAPAEQDSADTTNVASVTIDGTTTEYATLASAITAANKADSATITLLANIADTTSASNSKTITYYINGTETTTTLKYVYGITGDITLNLAGYTISYGSAETTMTASAGLFLVTGSLEVTTLGSTGGISQLNSGATDYQMQIFQVAPGATLEILKGKYETNSAGLINTYGTTTISAGDFSMSDIQTKDGCCMMYAVGSDAELTVIAGTIAGPSTNNKAHEYGIYALYGASIVLGKESSSTGPVITTYYSPVGFNNTTAEASMVIYGGTYTSTAANSPSAAGEQTVLFLACAGDFYVYGGTFTSAEGKYWASIPYKTNSVNLYVYGGTFVADGGIYVGTGTTKQTTGVENTISVSGGSFSSLNATGAADKATGSALAGLVNYLTSTQKLLLRRAVRSITQEPYLPEHLSRLLLVRY